MKPKRFFILLAATLSGISLTWIIFLLKRTDNIYYGLAILPLIIISIFLGLLGFGFSFFITREVSKK
jgi:uncharacterized membrane protein YcjF (UPF0283 family)